MEQGKRVQVRVHMREGLDLVGTLDRPFREILQIIPDHENGWFCVQDGDTQSLVRLCEVRSVTEKMESPKLPQTPSEEPVDISSLKRIVWTGSVPLPPQLEAKVRHLHDCIASMELTEDEYKLISCRVSRIIEENRARLLEDLGHRKRESEEQYRAAKWNLRYTANNAAPIE